MRANIRNLRHSVLAGIGLVSLLIYVLACTSFSPDDRQVLFPAFDVHHGGPAAMVYDRKTHKTELAYTRAYPLAPGATNRESGVLRPEWLSDGRHILIACQNTPGDRLEVSVVPWGVREPVRVFQIATNFVQTELVMPFPVGHVHLRAAGRHTHGCPAALSPLARTEDGRGILHPLDAAAGNAVLGLRALGSDRKPLS